MGEKRDGQLFVRIGDIDLFEGLHVPHALHAVDIGTERIAIEYPHGLGRQISAPRVRRMRVVDRQEIGENRDSVKQNHDEQTDERQLMPLEP